MLTGGQLPCRSCGIVEPQYINSVQEIINPQPQLTKNAATRLSYGRHAWGNQVYELPLFVIPDSQGKRRSIKIWSKASHSAIHNVFFVQAQKKKISHQFSQKVQSIQWTSTQTYSLNKNPTVVVLLVLYSPSPLQVAFLTYNDKTECQGP